MRPTALWGLGTQPPGVRTKHRSNTTPTTSPDAGLLCLAAPVLPQGTASKSPHTRLTRAPKGKGAARQELQTLTKPSRLE